MSYSKEKLGVGKELPDESVCCDSEEEGSQEAFLFFFIFLRVHLSSPQIPYSISRWVDGNRKVSCFFVDSKKCAKCIGYLSREWSVDIVIVVIPCRMFLPIHQFGPSVPQFTRKWIHSIYCNFFSVRASHGSCRTVHAKVIDEWWLSQIGSSFICQVSDPQY